MLTKEGRDVEKQMSQRDYEELAARRAHDAEMEKKYRGWKPLTLWYSFWAALFALGGISALTTGQVGVFLVALVLCALCVLYVRNLYNGGRHRVWFVIF
jgi:hypothetical protein